MRSNKVNGKKVTINEVFEVGHIVSKTKFTVLVKYNENIA